MEVQSNRGPGPQQDSILKDLFLTPELDPSNFDQYALHNDERLKVVYFWGEDCPNCNLASQHMRSMLSELRQVRADFYSTNAFKHMELTNRFGLFGIPAFLLFKRGRLLGKITSFPGRDEFLRSLGRFV